MRYRIKIKTFKNGRKEYTPQVKKLIGWSTLNYSGESGYLFENVYDTRERALEKIDLHYEGNTTKQSIEFEYINK